ncbi:glutamate-tRNA ligase, variant 1 [Aphanomyces astaci]|uniref:glutamate--tRNA ligase n=1 Tax=Aphanomyces astaci TaxID=112090 RepID=W4FP55_APHAT|nr:glutamate-tRNA ligase, variant 1 [Aphanomyces astaci]ETV68458.1 glutamate-tRNA ligase, variant 1 [Aphanomyces astaci]|eukprot:XP_009842083.1 glutamate-tRNA ligase, variant 1 [Aphanomyces astaci]
MLRVIQNLGQRPLYCRSSIFARPGVKYSTSPAPVRVRYAPSPTGYLHLGGLRTALFNYLFAKAHGGAFLMRIEDTDQTRKVDGSVEALTHSLQWCGIHEDEGPTAGGNFGPYVQSERLHLYKSYADTLLQDGHAYRCFCSQERLKSLRDAAARSGSGTMYDRACLGLDAVQVEEKLARNEPHTIRLKVSEGKTTLKDLVRGYVQFDHSVIDDQVLMKSDGFPTYHLANVVDDHLMGITHVIRGEEWLSSTPKHLLLYQFLGFEPPKFAHLGLLLNEDRSKLSKRQGDVAVEDFQKKGFLAPGLVNFVALLGWNPSDGNTQEIFTLDELKHFFSMDHVNKSGSVVNVERLRWINSKHIRRLFDDPSNKADVVAMLRPYLLNHVKNIDAFDVEFVWAAASLMKERVGALPDFGPLIYYFFAPPDLEASTAVEMKAKYWNDHTTDAAVADVTSRLQALPEGGGFTSVRNIHVNELLYMA